MWGNSAAYQRGPWRYASQLFTARPSVFRGGGGACVTKRTIFTLLFVLPTMSQASTATVLTGLSRLVALNGRRFERHCDDRL